MPHDGENSNDLAHEDAEHWREIAGFEGLYEVSDHGRVRGVPRLVDVPASSRSPAHVRQVSERILGTARDASGYPQANLWKDGKGSVRRVHALVLEAFVAPRPPGAFCCHRDGSRTNNRADNLYWGSALENHLDAKRHGTFRTGEAHGSARLTNRDVQAMRDLDGKVPRGLIAQRFGISATHASGILNGRYWRTA